MASRRQPAPVVVSIGELARLQRVARVAGWLAVALELVTLARRLPRLFVYPLLAVATVAGSMLVAVVVQYRRPFALFVLAYVGIRLVRWLVPRVNGELERRRQRARDEAEAADVLGDEPFDSWIRRQS